MDCSLCDKCKGVIGMICASCGTKTMEKFHEPCLYMVPEIQSGLSCNPHDYIIQKIMLVS